MTDLTLEILREELAPIHREIRVINDRLARIESKVDAIPVLLPSMRDRLNVLDAQIRSQGAILARLEDTISMDVLDRVRRLETKAQ